MSLKRPTPISRRPDPAATVKSKSHPAIRSIPLRPKRKFPSQAPTASAGGERPQDYPDPAPGADDIPF